LDRDRQKKKIVVLPLSGSHRHWLYFTFFKILCVFISPNERNRERHKWRRS